LKQQTAQLFEFVRGADARENLKKLAESHFSTQK
jgi:hypothetical protein